MNTTDRSDPGTRRWLRGAILALPLLAIQIVVTQLVTDGGYAAPGVAHAQDKKEEKKHVQHNKKPQKIAPLDPASRAVISVLRIWIAFSVSSFVVLLVHCVLDHDNPLRSDDPYIMEQGSRVRTAVHLQSRTDKRL